jgi:hypothetical protein
MTRHDDTATDATAWELELERFASGEMARADEDRFLARCESEPERWRDAALACIEHRRLGSLLTACRPSVAVGSAVGPSMASSHRTSLRTLFAVAATIALVAVGTALGYRIGVARAPGVPSTEVAAAGREAPLDPELAEQLAGLVRPILPEAAANVLREAGIEVHQEPVVYVVDGNDGQRWAVPETQLELRLTPDRGRRP